MKFKEFRGLYNLLKVIIDDIKKSKLNHNHIKLIKENTIKI